MKVYSNWRKHRERNQKQAAMVGIHSRRSFRQVPHGRNLTSALLTAELQLTNHERREEDKTFCSGDESKRLIRDDAGLCRKMSESHPEKKKSSQNV
jgi:hypothetical protein